MHSRDHRRRKLRASDAGAADGSFVLGFVPLSVSGITHDAFHPDAWTRSDVIHSVLAPAALVRHLLPAFDVGTVLSCSLLAHNQNDVYLVRTTQGRFVLRLSRAHAEASSVALAALFYELELLLHLDRSAIPVSIPIPRRDGQYVSSINAPEGERYVVLFTHARGEPLTPSTQTLATSVNYGRAVASLHHAADQFSTAHARPSLDVAHLINGPLDAARPLLSHRSDDWTELCRIAARLRARIEAFSAPGLDSGACHGDLTGGNANMTDHGEITLYDFEQCGPGWRAYDLAVFRWALAVSRERLNWEESHIKRLWASYLQGYAEGRSLEVYDLEAVPAFVMARQFWYLGLRATNRVHWGIAETDDRFFDWLLAFLRQWDSED